jgi:benzoyl-CoA reductase/2-hydroxyglutaryl-CoA dehydratase subunit BcrC/BadD/HgdB
VGEPAGTPVGALLTRLDDAYRRRLAGMPEPAREPVVGDVGAAVPLEVFDAAGLRVLRICGDPDAATPLADTVAEAAIDGMARSQLERLLDGTYAGLTAVFVGHDTEASARLFHYASECRHQGVGSVPPVHVVDVSHLPSPASLRYTLDVVVELRLVVGELVGAPISDDALRGAIERSNRRRRLLRQVAMLRRGDPVRLTGIEALSVFGAAATMSLAEHTEALADLVAASDQLPGHSGRRVFLTGTAHDHPAHYEALDARGDLVVGEDHDWGEAWCGDLIGLDPGEPPDLALARSVHGGAPRAGRHPIAARARHVAEQALATGAQAVVAVLRRGDDGPPWDLPAQRAALAEHGLDLEVVRLPGYRATPPADRGHRHRVPASTRPRDRDEPGGSDRRERPKGLEASAAATAYQRQWFADLRDQVAAGCPLAVVNADAPHEILRAMDIPYVVNQWWASVCAAKQQGPRYLGHLRRLGFPDDIEAYSAMALGSALDPDPTDAPWGGLPPVDLLVAETTTDATAKIFETWSDVQDAELVLLDATVAPLRPRRWFDHIHDHWESVIGTRRLDLMEAQIRHLVERAASVTGQAYDEARLAEVMALANEQADWNARTRDLIARTAPAPIGVADAIPATMIPQWHRGSEWGRDAARRLHDEVAARVSSGDGVVPEERARLMWIGRGLWFDMGFYQRFQERHGAVFVWSMYLAVAADAYLRRGGDPLRQLAARFCGFADLYNTPPWSAEWYAKEAVHNQIDGVVHLTTDAVRGTHFITRAIEAAGVPVLEIGGSNVDARDWDPIEVEAVVDDFVTSRALPRGDRRRAHKV